MAEKNIRNCTGLHCAPCGKAGNKGLALRLVMPYVQACKHAL